MTASADSVAAGSVHFAVTNTSAATVHEFVIIRTDTPAAELPLLNDEVSEDQVEVVDEIEDIAPGATAALDVDLSAGHYALICNLLGHYGLGMHTDLTVE